MKTDVVLKTPFAERTEADLKRVGAAVVQALMKQKLTDLEILLVYGYLLRTFIQAGGKNRSNLKAAFRTIVEGA